MTRRYIVLLLVMFLFLAILLVQALPSAQLSPGDAPSAAVRSSTPPTRGLLAKRTPSKAEGFILSIIRHGFQVSEDQWKRLKPKLRHLQLLHMQATLGTSLTLHRSSSVSQPAETKVRSRRRPRPGRAPRFQIDEHQQEKNRAWRKRWDEVPIIERTRGEKLIDRIIFLLERESVPPHLFQRQMKALRQYKQQRSEESDKAMDELLNHLTMRQQAVLVLKGWL